MIGSHIHNKSGSGNSTAHITPKQKIAADRAKYGLFMTESQCMHFCSDYSIGKYKYKYRY